MNPVLLPFRLRWWLFAVCWWCNVLPSGAQTNRPLLFKEVPLPQPWDPMVYRLNKAWGYTVRNKGGKLVTGLTDVLGQPRPPVNLTIPAGRFEGLDHGEFGGVLRFYGPDPQAPPVLVKEGNVRLIFQHRGQVYFLEGLAHLGHSAGALYQVTGTAPAFGYTQVLAFDDAPEAFAVVKDTVYIAQSHGFTVLRALRPDAVVKRTFWGGLYPNSVAVFGDTAYVGMRGGYARVIMTTQRVTFFKRLP